MIKELMDEFYGIQVSKYSQLSTGASSKTFMIESDSGNYILKNPEINSINRPNQEPEICDFLLNRGIPVSEFIKISRGIILLMLIIDYIICRSVYRGKYLPIILHQSG